MRSIDEANKCRLGRETRRGDINTNEGEGNTSLYCLLSHSGNLGSLREKLDRNLFTTTARPD